MAINANAWLHLARSQHTVPDCSSENGIVWKDVGEEVAVCYMQQMNQVPEALRSQAKLDQDSRDVHR